MGTTWPANELRDVGKPVYEPFVLPRSNSLTLTTVRREAPLLIHVEYPGLVLNPDRALRTLGGTAKVSETFNDPRRKLELRFRPGDVYSNAVTGDGSTTCGLLIKIRRRKRPPAPVPEAESNGGAAPVDLMGLEPLQPIQMNTSRFIRTTASGEEFEVIKGAENIVDESGKCSLQNEISCLGNSQDEGLSARVTVLPDGSFVSRDMLLADEEAVLERIDQKYIEQTCDGPVGRTGMEKQRIYIQIPPKPSPPQTSDLTVTAVGLVHRQYKFSGLCDYQYLPTKKNKFGKQKSIRNNILPLFADPDSEDPKKSMLVCNFKPKGHGRRKKIPSFLVPAMMSRLEKPLDSTENFLEETFKEADSPPQHSIQSSRARRIVYSHMCNFRVTDEEIKNSKARMLVPETALKEALVEAEKRGLLGLPFEQIQAAFEARPIWTKQALEFDTQMGRYELKYVLPCVAYFALNGPWRSCWIRLGYDPRTYRTSFRYQLLDYRVPAAYRTFLPKETEVSLENSGKLAFSFQPGDLPPKSQMFYQFCEVHIPQVEALTLAITARLDNDTRIKFDPTFGFLDEDMAEFCRLSISRFIEIRLLELGKITSVTIPELELLPGGQVPPRPIGKGPIGRSLHRMRSGKISNLTLPSDETEQPDEDSLMADLSIDPELTADAQMESDEEDLADEDDPILQEILRITRQEAEVAKSSKNKRT